MSNKPTDSNHIKGSNKKGASDFVTLINESAEVIIDNKKTPSLKITSGIKIGSKINRITIEKLLGKGGMGSVYLGYDEKLKRKVAVKSIRPEHLSNPSTHERFIREAQILSKINHPSICHIYDYIESDSGDYLILEYIQGKEFNRANLSKTNLLEAFFELANALAGAHKHGIVHRDLKPDNIMITNDGNLKVLDFGIAQSLSQHKPQKTDGTPPQQESNLTQQGSLVGTIRYMSPEQARGEMITTASDIYSLGIILQEIYSNEAAYEIIETNQLLHDVQIGNRLTAKNIPNSIKKLIDKLCQKDPDQRPMASAVANDIKQIQQAPITKKRKLILSLISLSIFAMLALALFQWENSIKQKRSFELTKSYTHTINNLVKNAEQIYVLPIHNVRPEISELLLEAEYLFNQIDQDPNLTRLDRLKLQGLILLEAEDYENSVKYLENAQANDYLLARAWMALYIEKAGEYAEIHGVEQTLKAKDLREKYLIPAINYIKKSIQNDEVMNAFKVSQTQSLDNGLILLDEILIKQKWNKKAIQLKSLILMAQAENFLQKGNWQKAKFFYQETANTYEKAIQMARSYPENYLELCNVRGIMLYDGLHRTGLDIEENFQSAIQACENHLKTIAEDSYTMNLMAKIYFYYSQWQVINDKTSQESLENAITWNQKSLEIVQDANNYWTNALIHLAQVKKLLSSEKLAQIQLDLAYKSFNSADKLMDQAPAYYLADKIYSLALQAELNNRHQKQMSQEIKQAEHYYQQANQSPNLDINEKRMLRLNLGLIYYHQLNHQYQTRKDIRKTALQLIKFYQESTKQIIDEPNLLISLINTQLLYAQYCIENKRPVDSLLDSILSNIKATEIIGINNSALILSKARFLSMQAQVSDNNFKQANKQFQEAHKTNLNEPIINYFWAKSLIIQKKLTVSKTQKDVLLDLAMEQINLAIKLDPKNTDFIQLKNTLYN